MRGVLSALVLLALVGCTTTTLVRPADLARLDGYDARRPASAERALPAISGGSVTFGPATRLYLDLPDGVAGGRFDWISVHDGSFDGSTPPPGRRILVPLGDVENVRVTQPAPRQTGVLVAGLVLAGFVTTIAAVFLVAGLPHDNLGFNSPH